MPPSLIYAKLLTLFPIDHYWKNSRPLVLMNTFEAGCSPTYRVGSNQLSKTSSTVPVLSGVPQGSVLGPLLFLIYINDSVSAHLNPGTYVTTYADDLLLHREINCPEDYFKLQQDVNKIANWVDVNQLTLNSKKCKFIIVSRRRGRSVPNCTLTLNGQSMKESISISILELCLQMI